MPVEVERFDADDEFIDFPTASQWIETNRDRNRKIAVGILRQSGTLFLVSIGLLFFVTEKLPLEVRLLVSSMFLAAIIAYLISVIQSIRSCIFEKEYPLSTQKKAYIDLIEVLKRETSIVKQAYYALVSGMVLNVATAGVFVWQMVK
jgi:hypothetical protein